MRHPRSIASVALLVALVSLAPSGARAGAEADLRQTLQAHPWKGLDGTDARPDLEPGSVILVNFWAEWCAPCRRELPVLDGWQEQWRESSVEFVCISIDREARSARRMARELGLTLPLYHDGPEGLARELDLPALPITYVLDGRGELSLVSTGSDAESLARLHRHVQELLDARDTARVDAEPSSEEAR